MTPEKIIVDLIAERKAIRRREREVTAEIFDIIVDQKMIDFISINWRRLERVFRKDDRRIP